MPALSPTILRAHMFVGLPAASAMMGCVVEDVTTVANGASAAALALEMVFDRVRPFAIWLQDISCLRLGLCVLDHYVVLFGAL